MLLQCLKCTLFYRSFSKLKSHKSVGPCADKLKLKNKTENLEEYSKVEDLAKSIQGTKIDDENTLEENVGDNMIGHYIKTEPNEIIKEIKTEPTEAHPANIKLESKDDFEVAKPASLMRYDDTEEYVPAPIVVVDSDDEYEPESDDSAPDDDDVEAILGLARKRLNKTKKRKKRDMDGGKVAYITMASGQRMKKFSAQKEERTKFVPNKIWLPFRTQVSVKQVCQYLEMKDILITSTPALRITCRNRRFFDRLARPLARRANPQTHPLVMDTFLRAKWFELMNTEEEVEEEEDEEVMKRKREEEENTNVKVKKIKLKVAKW